MSCGCNSQKSQMSLLMGTPGGMPHHMGMQAPGMMPQYMGMPAPGMTNSLDYEDDLEALQINWNNN